jgi:hypothetical protein
MSTSYAVLQWYAYLENKAYDKRADPRGVCSEDKRIGFAIDPLVPALLQPGNTKVSISAGLIFTRHK